MNLCSQFDDLFIRDAHVCAFIQVVNCYLEAYHHVYDRKEKEKLIKVGHPGEPLSLYVHVVSNFQSLTCSLTGSARLTLYTL